MAGGSVKIRFWDYRVRTGKSAKQSRTNSPNTTRSAIMNPIFSGNSEG